MKTISGRARLVADGSAANRELARPLVELCRFRLKSPGVKSPELSTARRSPASVFLCSLLGSAISLAWTISLGASTATSVQENFRAPPNEYKPMLRWWWPGNDVVEKELRREIREMSAAGFGGVEINAISLNLRNDLSAEARERIYAAGTQPFFAHVRAAVEEARAHGMWVDLSFGSGWPFGGQAVTPESSMAGLTYLDLPLQGGTQLRTRLEMPQLGPSNRKPDGGFLGVPPPALPEGWLTRMRARAKTVAVLAVRATAAQLEPPNSYGQRNIKVSGQIDVQSVVDLTSRVADDGTLDWTVPEGEWHLLVFRYVATDHIVAGGAAPGAGLVVDHFNRPAFDDLAKQFGDAMRPNLSDASGRGLRALFCDSLEIEPGIYWSDDFLQEFQRRRGYDLTRYLPLIKQQFVSYSPTSVATPFYDIPTVGNAVRRDYWKTVGELISERLYQPFSDWAADHHLLARIQAHGAPADLLSIYGRADIPETESNFARGTHDFMKLASSAADIYGRKVVSSEHFVGVGNAYGTTPERLKIDTDSAIIAGVNQLIYHGYPYVYDDRPYPGWAPWAITQQLNFTSVINGRSTFWPYISTINEYISRLQYVFRTGKSLVPIAVFISESGYDSLSPSRRAPPLTHALQRAGYAYDHLNADGLLRSRVEDGQLITPGGVRFSAVILNDVDWLDVKVAEKLAQAATGGVSLIVIGSPPGEGATLLNLAAESRAVRAAMRVALAAPRSKNTASVDAAVALLPGLVRPNVQFVAGNTLPFIEKKLEGLDALFIRNPESTSVSTHIVSAAPGSPQIWDPWSGKISPFVNFKMEGGAKRLHIDLPAYGSILLVFDPLAESGPKAPPSAPSITSATLDVGSSGWTLQATGYGLDGMPVTVDRRLTRLADWNQLDGLTTFAGRGRYLTKVDIPPNSLQNGQRISLDLGEVQNVAEIRLNGVPGPVLLMHPYVADVTDLVRAGSNDLEITVVNAPSNAVSPRPPVVPLSMSSETWPTAPFQPLSAGLLGPVTLKVLR